MEQRRWTGVLEWPRKRSRLAKDIMLEPRTCIVVLGMHRSGTSALTRVLGILGAALPRHVMGPGQGNKTGHWEPKELVTFHDRLLYELHSSWDDWSALDIRRLTPRRRDVIKARIAAIILAEYGCSSLFVVKDPRICRFAPLFLEALADAGITTRCVLIFRNPLEVAQSLERRDGMSRREAGLLWLRHVLDAEIATRERRRAILSYDGLLTDWKGELQRVIGGTGCVLPNPAETVVEDVERFLNSEQRHHWLSAKDITCDAAMCTLIAEVYDALQTLREDPASHAALRTFDRARMGA